MAAEPAELLARFVDDFARIVILARDLPGPSGDLARLVVAGVEAGRADDVEGLLGVIPELLVRLPGGRADESGRSPALEGALAAKVATVATLLVAVDFLLPDEEGEAG